MTQMKTHSKMTQRGWVTLGAFQPGGREDKQAEQPVSELGVESLEEVRWSKLAHRVQTDSRKPRLR